MEEEKDNIEFSANDLALIEALRKVKRKKRRRFILFLLLMTVIVACTGIYLIKHPKQLLFVKDDTFTIELGNSVSIKPQDYLDKNKTDEDAYKNCQLSSSILKNQDEYTITDDKKVVSKDKNYLNVGEYKFKITYLSQNQTITVNVVDTTKPVFEIFTKTIEVEAETKEIKWSDYYQATDLTDVKIDVDDSNVDLNKAGTYKIKVKATDENNNSVTKNAEVTVKEKPTPTPTPTPEPAVPAQNNGNSYTDNNQSANNNYVAPEPTPVAPAQQESHGTQYFMFDSGYDFDSAYGACVAAMTSHGSGSCTPITDAEGTYTGYVLNY